MAFWKKKSEDPWDIDPNRKRETTLFYERDPEPQPAFAPERKEESGLATPQTVNESDAVEEPEIGPECPWCGEKMVRAYIIGGRDRPRLSDEKPSAFLGVLGQETMAFSDEGFWTTHKSCWQCKPCRKLVADLPEPVPEDSFARWDGNPVAPPSPEEIEP